MGTRPLVVDPFAGGGAIPLEALRVGADAFASDLNPVAVLLNKVLLEYIPKYGQRLADEVRQWGRWVKEHAEKELAPFYPKDAGGSTPIAYLWARTIRCEGPGCGAEVPLMRSLWLAKKGSRSVALKLLPNAKQKCVDFEIIHNAKPKDVAEGTIKRGSATCPSCGYTTPVTSMREQLRLRRGGGDDAKLIAVRFDDPKTGDRSWRAPSDEERAAPRLACLRIRELSHNPQNGLSAIPDEPLPPIGALGFRVQNYGMLRWGDLFTSRQALCLTTLGRLTRSIPIKGDDDFVAAVHTCLALAIDRLADFNASLCVLNSVGGRGVVHVFGRQALPMVWDFMETNPFNTEAANWDTCYEVVDEVIANERNTHVGNASHANAARHPLPDDSATAFITDPPYYDAVPYADLSDFFYVWLRRNLPVAHSALMAPSLTNKDEECIVDPVRTKGREFFQRQMNSAMAEGRRTLQPNGIGVVVFAHKSTAGWESQLQAMVDAGWTVTGSWPIDTERPGRLRAQDSAALASSVHLVCRPREDANGNVRDNEVGDWREVLAELPIRIHEWMPRLTKEGVVGADAIFASLGPALEIFSRYSRVEKASGEQVSLREYLEQVWAAVSQEALRLVFEKADASGFEEDARLTAMWLWTLSTGNGQNGAADSDDDHESDDDEAATKKKKSNGGFALEYDTARKISQGLGVKNLERMTDVVEIDGDTARLLAVSERTKALFGKDQADAPTGKRKKKDNQMKLAFAAELEQSEAEGGWGEKGAPKVGTTTLDRVHQSMILFAAGRSEAMKRFLVEEAVGRDGRFWTLADCLSKLYPPKSDEKRWVDGVLARKKGLGF